MKEQNNVRFSDKVFVNIVPTEETSFGIEDKYNIKLSTGKVLHTSISREEVKAIVKLNSYNILSGNEYLFED